MMYSLAPPYRIPAYTGGPDVVRLSDDARKCVVYLGYGAPGIDNEISPEGTGFFIHTGEPGGSYLVTALHVAERLNGPFHIRYNQKSDGKGRVLHYEESLKWYTHPNHPDKEIVDVAVTPLDPPEWADYIHFPRTSFLSEQKLESKNIGAGDLAYIVGLYLLLYGEKRNMPLVHTGNIALMAEDEPIPVTDWTSKDPNARVEINGYLIEAHTLPGISGSPVFVRRTVSIEVGSMEVVPNFSFAVETNEVNEDAIKTWGYGTVWLLGLWHGGWEDEPRKMLAIPKNRKVNAPIGMGITIPTTKIIEVIDQPKLKDIRNAVKTDNDAVQLLVKQQSRMVLEDASCISTPVITNRPRN